MHIEEAIEQIEKLYEVVTGKPMQTAVTNNWQIPPTVNPVNFLTEKIEHLIATLHNSAIIPIPAPWNPPVCIWENEKEILMKVDLGGVRRDEVDLSIKNNILIISGTRKHLNQLDGYTPKRLEMPVGPFLRWIPLPTGVRANELHSRMVEGLLEITIPKLVNSQAPGVVQ